MGTKFAITSKRIITENGVIAGSIVVENGKIADIVEKHSIENQQDVDNDVVMPGLIDSHVHINEPGRTHWEGFTTATQAAAAGGITTLIDMPLNSTPVTTTPESLQQKMEASSGKLWVDCGFHGGVVPDNLDQIEFLIEKGVLGIKSFLVHSGIDDFPNTTIDDLDKIMPILARHKVPLLVHAEIEIPTKQVSHPQGYQEYLASRPDSCEVTAIKRLITLCEKHQCPLHIVHLATAQALTMLEQARKHLPITVETCPHYLYFAAEQIRDGNTLFKCAPPIRNQANQDELWRALQNGIIDMIASDHSPCPPEMKLIEQGDFFQSWGGISSLQLTLPVVWSKARQHSSLLKLAEWLCYMPAKIFQIPKGKIEIGYDADFVIWSPEEPFTVQESMIFHRHKMTPYLNENLYGVVKQTYLRGQQIFANGKIVPQQAPGKILRAGETNGTTT